MSSVWVLTFTVNDYNQRGAYFAAWFRERPTAERLIADCGLNLDAARALVLGVAEVYDGNQTWSLQQLREGQPA